MIEIKDILKPILPHEMMLLVPENGGGFIEEFEGLKAESIGHNFFDDTEGDIYRALTMFDYLGSLIFPTRAPSGELIFEVRHKKEINIKLGLINGPKDVDFVSACLQNYRINILKFPKIVNKRFLK